ncbi:unnamed protein product [Sphagnum balticum]
MPDKSVMQDFEDPNNKVWIENMRKPSQKELDLVGEVYNKFYRWRGRRQGTFKQFQDYTFDDYIAISRELFWNAVNAASQDLSELGINIAIPFIRKDQLDFLGRMMGMQIKPRIIGDDLNNAAIRMINGLYSKWRTKSNQKVEKFWQLLYAMTNGTVIMFVGYNDAKRKQRFVRNFNRETGAYKIEEKDEFIWNDVWEEVCPIEDIYVPKLEERDIQKQGEIIHRTQYAWKDFKDEFRGFKNAEFVYPGTRVAEDSLYFQLLASSGISTTDRVEVLKYYDNMKDRHIILANGIWLNPMTDDEIAPMPFDHKLLPFIKGENKPIDEKFFYGLSTPFDMKDPHKILNTMMATMLERDLRVLSPPILTNDIDAPDLIYGDNQVIPVGDPSAYKELEVQDISQSAFAMSQQVQGILTSNIQGGNSNIMGGKQPKSAKEVNQLEQVRQQAMTNATILYYNILRQEIMLVVKTALQFYPTSKYSKYKKDIIRSMMVPDSPLMNGGLGNMEIRFVKKNSTPLQLFEEMVKKSMESQKMTEIIEIPIDLITDLDFEITDIELVSEKSTELEQSMFVEKIMQPMMPYIQAGIVDPVKLFLRWMEKMNEHPADYVSDKVLPQVMNTWSNQYQFPGAPGTQQPGQQQQPGQTQQPAQPQPVGGQVDLCAEVFTHDLIGVTPQSVLDNNALAFIRKNSGMMRKWVLYISNDLQQRKLIYGDKGSFYNGALFITKLFYVAAMRGPANEAVQKVDTDTVNKVNPFEALSKFVEGMKKEDFHGTQSSTESSEDQSTNL